jgi:hypothetical protein
MKRAQTPGARAPSSEEAGKQTAAGVVFDPGKHRGAGTISHIPKRGFFAIGCGGQNEVDDLDAPLVRIVECVAGAAI